jgi:hypothetical protein
MKKSLIAGLLAMTAACTTTEKMDWVLVGGSKADGNIILGIDVPPKMGITETIVEWDVNKANAEATRRCQNWGYGGAEIYRNGQFPVLKTCHAQGISPCWSKIYRIQYQCIDKG